MMFILMTLIMVLEVLSVHAIAKNGIYAISASQCADFPEIRMLNPTTGRIALICLTDHGWGIYIQDRNGENVTAFVKNKMNKLEDVIRYMRNAGYQIIQ